MLVLMITATFALLAPDRIDTTTPTVRVDQHRPTVKGANNCLSYLASAHVDSAGS